MTRESEKQLKLDTEKFVLDEIDEINAKLSDLLYFMYCADVTKYKQKLLRDVKKPLRKCYRHIFIWYLRRQL